jgi:simple sugar transport system ATP-binding protein
VANDGVGLRVRAQSVHAVVGENGAGKTTLMRIAYGMLRPDQGEVWIRGQPLGSGGVARAIQLGLGMVHQHFMLVPTLSVAENVVLGSEPRRGPWLDRTAAQNRVRAAAAQLGVELDPDAQVGDLSVGEQQRVELIKVLVRGARVLILDEPTAVLGPREAEELFAILRRLVQANHSVVLVTHRLQEVLALADDITVLRDGRAVAEIPARDASPAQLVRLIVGRELPVVRRLPEADAAGRHGAAETVLRCESLRTAGTRGALHEVSLEVRRGEIVGVAGVEGNGQQALADVVAGLASTTGGRIVLLGEDVTRLSPGARRARGLAYVPADRGREGLVEEMRIDENAVLGRQRRPELGRGPWLDPRRVTALALELLRRFEVRPARPTFPAAILSGGNQQRLLVGREMEQHPDFLLLAQPTRGVDVGGIAFLHERILVARAAGAGVLLISADLNEILALADRIVVLFGGRVVGEVPAAAADPARLGLWMTGSAEGVA